ncbi:allatostatin-A receptor [Biomphalaria pfeifferi]|uniref:Allatostatin-A receptor n=1 Tax=Biomphalaria pfeifferi TaxID=112525 RepID=A0AAD8F346_BIOPF|nr:allatostatin-A receptor [Biomphalaria pfeifferi]
MFSHEDQVTAWNHNETLTYIDEPRLFISDDVRAIIIVINYCVIGVVINTFGIITNIINLIVFSKMELKDTVTISLFGLTLSDMCSLLTLLWSGICYNPLFRSSDIAIESFEVEYITAGAPHVCFTRITGLITAYITIERSLCIALPLKVKSLLTPKRTVVIVTLIFVFNIANVIPAFTVDNLEYKYYPSRNRSLIGLVFQVYREKVETYCFASSNFLCYVTFLIVVTCTAVLVFKLNNQRKWRQESSSLGNAVALVTKDKKVVKMVIIISGIFIVCYFPMTVVFMGTIAVSEFGLVGRYENLYHVICSAGYAIESINSCVSVFIYTKMSSKYKRVIMNFRLRRTTESNEKAIAN